MISVKVTEVHEARVMKVLAGHTAEKCFSAPSDADVFLTPLTKQQLIDRVGITPRVTRRALTRLVTDGPVVEKGEFMTNDATSGRRTEQRYSLDMKRLDEVADYLKIDTRKTT
ncbi:hypothetical protein H0W80_00425 [Candidatus Saccharibacteria bacterium]|nr:hypothetical protein [Candidatus Saccharibacteria bacterium]